MENQKHIKKNERDDMNMIINEPQNNIKEWNNILNNL
jgi:hypothetical protein